MRRSFGGNAIIIEGVGGDGFSIYGEGDFGELGEQGKWWYNFGLLEEQCLNWINYKLRFSSSNNCNLIVNFKKFVFNQNTDLNPLPFFIFEHGYFRRFAF